MRLRPERLPGVLLTLVAGAACVWLMFSALLPVAAAVLLLLGACADYLAPMRFEIGPDGVSARGAAGRFALAWSEARRVIVERDCVTITPLSRPSRLDAFRGVTLRFAPPGAPGDRDSVLAEIARRAPALADALAPPGSEKAPAQ